MGNTGHLYAFDMGQNAYFPAQITATQFNGTLNGAVKDVGNGTSTTFAYSKAGLDTASWFAAWNGYELRAIAPSKVLSTIGAAASSHTHSYLPLSGGTLTGELIQQKNKI
jgi:hypothetical protein